MQKLAKTEAPQASTGWWLWPNILSLDAACVAVLWNLLLAKAAAPEVLGMPPVLLGLAVWAIYLIDHLLDARNTPRGSHEPARKVVFRQHLRPMAVLTVVIAAAGLGLAPYRASPVILVSAWQAGPLAGFYLASIHLLPGRVRLQWPREAAVALVFTLGVCSPVWWSNHSRHSTVLAFALPFFLLCWLNCCAVETWDWRSGGSTAQMRPNSLTLWIDQHVRHATISVGLISLVLARAHLLPLSLLAAILLSCFSLSFLSSYKKTRRFAARTFLFDLTLCSPLPVLLIIR